MSDKMIYGEPLGPRVTEVTPIDDYKLLLLFDNGERRVFDVKPLLETEAFKSLCNKQLFNSVKVAYGSVLWPQEIDYCPDTLYMESAPVSEEKVDYTKLASSERKPPKVAEQKAIYD